MEQNNVVEIDLKEKETVEVPTEEVEMVQSEEEVTEVQDAEVTEEVDGEVKKEKDPDWMSFLIGVRGNNIYEAKTNIEECLLTDYTEAMAGLEMNVIVQVLNSVGIKGVESFLKLKEILVLNSVRMLGENLEQTKIKEEDYAELRRLFNIDEIEAMLNKRKEEVEAFKKEQQEEKEEEFKIEV